MIRADQSKVKLPNPFCVKVGVNAFVKDGVFDKGCLVLAGLCNEALDYPKHGRRVEVSRMPRRLMLYLPDWKKGEVDMYDGKFYRSERAIGQ